jgi:hypothetical protein
MLTQLLRDFAADDKLAGVLFLIAADLVLGAAAALKLGTFRLAYFAAFLRDDVLGKVVPWFGFYALAFFAPAVALPVIPVDLGDVAGAAYIALLAAFSGSILSSVAALVPAFNPPSEIGGGEVPPPGP